MRSNTVSFYSPWDVSCAKVNKNKEVIIIDNSFLKNEKKQLTDLFLHKYVLFYNCVVFMNNHLVCFEYIL